MKWANCFLLLFITTSVTSQKITPGKIDLIKSIACTPVKDQNISSTCWSFAGNSFIESELIRTKGIYIDLSEMFTARYSYINKLETYLATEGKIFFTPGGQFHDILKVTRQYGIMPEAAYSGRIKGLSHNHSELDTVMKYYAERLVANQIKKLSPQQLSYVNTILDKYLGKVPTQFMYEGKMYTPKTFASGFLNFNASDYIEITSYTHHPFYDKFVLEDRYNWSGDEYYNVPLEDFIEITNSAIKNNYSVCWDGDVTEDGFQFNNGVAFLANAISDFQAERQRTYEDKSSRLDHMMHITGMAKDRDDNIWYQVKNSWGSLNEMQGYLLMTENYFKIKTIAIIVNKNAVPAEILKKLKLLL